MKKSRAELETLKDFVDRTYSGIYGKKLFVSTEKQYDPEHNELGYCYKFVDDNGNVVYQIVCARTGLDDTDYRILLHEYGHIYLGHLDAIHEELDQQICNLFANHRQELIDQLNQSLGITDADKLIDRVIDDPNMNHSLHNIAEDMEVNSKVLSPDDIKEMETDLSTLIPSYNKELLEYIKSNEVDEKIKKELEEKVKELEANMKMKLILPEYYHTPDGKPFPDGLTYPDYLLLIVSNLDQFVRMLASLKLKQSLNGMTDQELKDLLNNSGRDLSNKSEEYKKGYQDALNDAKNNEVGKQLSQYQQNQSKGQQGQQGQDSNQNQQSYGQGQPGEQAASPQGQPAQGNGQGSNSTQGNGGPGQGQMSDYEQGYQDALNDLSQQGQGQGQGKIGGLLDQLFGGKGQGKAKSSPFAHDNTDPNNGDGGSLGPWADKPEHYTERRGIRDHGSDSREVADQKRRVGQIRAGGGISCGNSGGADVLREVDQDVDAVDMALNEVFRNMRTRVVKLSTKKDLMRNYNRGIVRSVISPSVTRKITIANEQKIVYLIDVSGSMDTELIDRILKSIKRNMARLSKGLRYDIIAWSTRLEGHIKDINPRREVPEFPTGGGTSIGQGIQYFKDNYGPEATLIIISDFEDNLNEWHEVEKTMNGYSIYGFNYGTNRWASRQESSIAWKNLKQRDFDND